MESKFGSLVRERRLALGLGLRKFCLGNELDPAFLSKLERGRIAIPGKEVLQKLAGALGLTEETKEWQEFMDLADAEAGRVPPDLLDDEEVIELLPAVFRTFRGERVDDRRRLDDLIKLLKRS